MLGFSLPKLLVLVAIVAAIWWAFNRFGGSKTVQKERKDRVKSDEPDAVDMTKCPGCGDFLAPGTKCTRPECPYSK